MLCRCSNSTYRSYNYEISGGMLLTMCLQPSLSAQTTFSGRRIGFLFREVLARVQEERPVEEHMTDHGFEYYLKSIREKTGVKPKGHNVTPGQVAGVVHDAVAGAAESVFSSSFVIFLSATCCRIVSTCERREHHLWRSHTCKALSTPAAQHAL